MKTQHVLGGLDAVSVVRTRISAWCVLALTTWFVTGCDVEPPVVTPPTTPPAQQTPAPKEPAPKPVPTDPNLSPTPAKVEPPKAEYPAMEKRVFDIAGKKYELELAVENQTRFHGLSGRTSIPDGTGLMFLFSQPQRMRFVMRDCPVPIDIIYIDATGRITAMHHMQPEPPRTDKEQNDPAVNAGNPAWSWTNTTYEDRLKKYDSRFNACVVIEVAGGAINIDGKEEKGLKLEVGQKLELDVGALRKLAKVN